MPPPGRDLGRQAGWLGLLAVAVWGVLPFLQANWPGSSPPAGAGRADPAEEECLWGTPGCGGPSGPAAGVERS